MDIKTARSMGIDTGYSIAETNQSEMILNDPDKFLSEMSKIS